jgi:ABC-type proline/glycine betaine transport system substrate-binding protein
VKDITTAINIDHKSKSSQSMELDDDDAPVNHCVPEVKVRTISNKKLSDLNSNLIRYVQNLTWPES